MKIEQERTQEVGEKGLLQHNETHVKPRLLEEIASLTDKEVELVIHLLASSQT